MSAKRGGPGLLFRVIQLATLVPVFVVVVYFTLKKVMGI